MKAPTGWQSTAASLVYVGTVAGIGWADGSWIVAVYAVSFWHYCTYALAFVFRSVSLPAFKRDAVLMKSAALLAIAPFYLAAGPGVLSLAVVASGFLLNIRAAMVLGSDRTYYGHELAGVPATWVTRFPYSLTSHPMLIGNMLAFAGTLLVPGFAAQWWPLILLHVALNFATILKEVHVKPIALAPPAPGDWWRVLTAWPVAATLLAVGAALAMATQATGLTILGTLICALAYGAFLFGRYAWPQPAGAAA